MSRFEFIDPDPRSHLLTLGAVARVADHLRQGGLAVLPTETGYLIAALATSEAAILDAYDVKSRATTNTMHVACSSVEMADRFTYVTPVAERILHAFTPGPVSVVVNRRERRLSDLVTRDDTIGIRIPAHAATLQVITSLGLPATATSLNRSGEKPGRLDEAGLRTLAWPAGRTVLVVRDDGSITYPEPSTLVRVTGEKLEVLRPGPVDESTILDMLAAQQRR